MATFVAASSFLGRSGGSLAMPTGYASRDVLLALIGGYTDWGATTVPPLPSGWNSLATNSGSRWYARAAYRIADGTESAITVAGSYVGSVAAYRGTTRPALVSSQEASVLANNPSHHMPFTVPAFTATGPLDCIAGYLSDTTSGQIISTAPNGAGWTVDDVFAGAVLGENVNFAWAHNPIAPGNTTAPLQATGDNSGAASVYWGFAEAASPRSGTTMLI